MSTRLAVFLAGLAAPATATEHEVATYGGVLETCFETSQQGARADCIGKMAEACMEAEDGGYSTLGMVMCTAAETQVWDRFLNAEYRSTMSALNAMDVDEGQYFPEFAKREDSLRDAQRAWITFRDAECGLAYAMWGSGSMRNIAAATCQLEMTAKRTLELQELGSEMR